MNIDQDMLDILINRQLDNEITPIEAQLLEERLAADPEAKLLCAQVHQLHRRAQVAIGGRLRQGRPAHEIVAAALRGGPSANPADRLRAWLFSQFTRGLAAGVIIAVALQMALSRAPVRDASPDLGAGVTQGNNPRGPAILTSVGRADPIRRNVDWYQFTDEQGNQWVVEGLREDRVRPAVYDGDF